MELGWNFKEVKMNYSDIGTTVQDYITKYKNQLAGITQNQPMTPPNVLGTDFNHLRGIFSNLMGGDPNNNAYRDAFSRQLGTQSRTAIRNINEQLSSSGFRGAGANLINGIFETQANSLEDFNNNLLQRDMAVKQNAINGLLGLTQFEGSQNMGLYNSQIQQNQFAQSLAERRREFDMELALQREAQNPSFFDVLGGVLGSVAGGFGGGLGGKVASKLF